MYSVLDWEDRPYVIIKPVSFLGFSFLLKPYIPKCSVNNMPIFDMNGGSLFKKQQF